MLIEFRVKNFKNFKKELVLNLNDTKNYEFNTNAIRDNVVNTCLIYGINGSGKSNLGIAMFDIVHSLTDNRKATDFYDYYLNLNSSFKKAKFYYKFKFKNTFVIYEYEKSTVQNLIMERLFINNIEVLFYDHKKQIGYTKIKGTETLNTGLKDKNISYLKYIYNNSVFTNKEECDTINKFFKFVNNMLLFSSLERNRFQGFKTENSSIAQGIIDSGNLKNFQNFLHNCMLDYELAEGENEGNKIITCKYKNAEANFFNIASNGTRCLTLFYYWLIQIEKVSLVFIDEFDAFYHNDLAKIVVQEVLKKGVQAIITTHNTSIMNNELLRPDCYFNLIDGKINSFANLIDKELRAAHNIEKMYKAGAFNGK